MEYLPLITTVLIAHVLGVISPGPDFLLVSKNALTYNRRTGIWTAVGTGLGIGVHIIYCLAGLAVIISKSILVFNIIKILGAGYLIYLGIKSLRAKSTEIKINQEKSQKEMTRSLAIRTGFLCNVLNPKATLFFLSLFTLAIPPETPRTLLAALGILMVVSTILWFIMVSYLFSNKKTQLIYNRFQGVINKTFGAILITLGVRIAIARE